MLVFTNGCFDVLHVGHIQYLEQSRALGDKLIVGLNSDASVRRLKGPTRPVNSQADRKRMLEALRCVDEVVIFDEDTPYDLIVSLQPDIVTKGGDYLPEDVVGYGLSRVVVLPYVDGKSTTRILNHENRREGLGPRGDLG
jgi:rfaE bifunctional protein nucleotidyltransferase chain/domain